VEIDQPLVTVCIPVHINHDYVTRAINSVLNQNYNNLEIIISINSATYIRDQLKSLLSENYNKIKIIDSSSRKGVSFALNSAIKISQGEYFAWLSSDDYWHEDHLKDHVEILAKSDDQVGVCLSGWKLVNGSKVTAGQVDFIGKEGNENKFLQLYKGRIMGCAVTLKTKVFKEIGLFDENRLYTQDYEFWLRLISKYEIIFSQELTTYYNIHSKQTTITENVEPEVTNLWKHIIDNINDSVLEATRQSKIQLILIIFDTLKGSGYPSLMQMLFDEMQREISNQPNKVNPLKNSEIEQLLQLSGSGNYGVEFLSLVKERNMYGSLAHDFRLISESQGKELEEIYNRKVIKLLKKLRYFT
jgi:teichuronic acid biosynthesis glycosyltransferase TuaG